MKLTRFARIVGDDAVCPAWVPPVQRRRLDPLARLATAVVDLAVPGGLGLNPDTGVIVSTSYGAVESTHRFLVGMAQFGDAAASPTPFTTSVHSSCAGALGELLGLHGPSTTISQGGLGTLSALRWADLVLTAGRAPAVLMVIGDRHNDWTRRIVATLSGSKWPIGDGAVALLAEPDHAPAPGRRLDWSGLSGALTLDGGGLRTDDESLLVTAATGSRRLIAPDLIGSWWPCCLLAGMDSAAWRDGPDCTLREGEGGQVLAARIGQLNSD